jgi:hypothetical protein
MTKTKSKTSPKGGKRGCLCGNGTYSKECCNGDLQNQGIGSTIQGGDSSVTNTSTSVTSSNESINSESGGGVSNVTNTNAQRVINNARG